MGIFDAVGQGIVDVIGAGLSGVVDVVNVVLQGVLNIASEAASLEVGAIAVTLIVVIIAIKAYEKMKAGKK
jgi:hypothetical protein